MKKNDFKPFDKVLVRDECCEWTPRLFSHMGTNVFYPYHTQDDCGWEMCIHYEGNEHLIGKTFGSFKPNLPKDGDFVRIETEDNGEWLLIWKEVNEMNEVKKHACYDLESETIRMDGDLWGELEEAYEIEVATEDEKQTFLNALFEEGFVWDAENKIIKRR